MLAELSPQLGALDLFFVFCAGLLGGIFNGVAGGGTLATFPALLAVGFSPITANITSSIGIVFSYVGGVRNFAGEIREHHQKLRSLMLVMAIGSISGSILLLTTPSQSFRDLAPWLVAFATLLYCCQPFLAGHLHRSSSPATRTLLLQAGCFVLSIYGGYFAAGMGIMLLALFGITMVIDQHGQTAMRTAVSLFVNAIATIIFIFWAHYSLCAAGLVAMGALIGGFIGAGAARRLPRTWFRAAVIALGTITSLRLFLG